ncbi:MAG TPA: DNA cytosine methyltransferase [Clostridia bacterium]
MSIQAIDLFCGIGGLTRGLLNANIQVVAGFDLDETCQYAYQSNNNVPFYKANIRSLHAEDLEKCYDEDAIRILVGCAPCQPFSQMRVKLGIDLNKSDEKYDLLLEFGRLIEELHPTIVSMENVPQIRKTKIFEQFIKILESNGYHIYYQVVYCPDYGIPQNRRRLVLLASTLGDITLIHPTHDRSQVTIRPFIENLPKINAGEVDNKDLLHRAASLSKLNLKRIQHSIPGGSWRDWPEELRSPCHKRNSGKTYTSVYSRMQWDAIGPTITTQFYIFGTGRYGHPEQDRALSLREGALLQTFPAEYNFINPERKFSFRDIARHIGNAVPVKLGEAIGTSINNHLKKYIE